MESRKKLGTFASLFGIISNFILSLLKILTGLLTATVSLTADGFNNLGDSLSSFISLVAFKLSSKKADSKHPFGHERIEYLSGFLVSVIIVVFGVELIISSIKKIITPDEITEKFLLNCIVLLFSIAVKIIQAIVNIRIGKKIDSETLLATAADSRNDVIASLGVLIGLIVSKYTGVNIDGYIGCVIGLFICYSGISFAITTASPLLGQAPDSELVKEFEKIIREYGIVLGVHDLEIHSYGKTKQFASCHVEVDSKGDILEVHDIIDQIEQRLKNELGILTTLHMDPILVNDPKTEKYLEFVKNVLKEEIQFAYTMHDFRIVSGPTHTNVIFDLLIPFSVKESEEALKNRLQNAIHTKDEGVYGVISIDYDYNNILGE